MRHHRKKTGIGRDIAALLGGGLLAAPFLLLIAGLTVWLGRLPAAALRIPVMLGWGCSAFFAARSIGLRRRHHGLLIGAVCGAFYFLIRICGALLLGIALRGTAFWFLLWLVPAGALGGVIGVNTRMKQPM